MKNLDYRHTAFHILIALYFIWLVVFAVLNGMAMVNYYGYTNPQLGSMLFSLLALNLFMGIILFIVIRMFRDRTLLNKVVTYSFAFIAGMGLTVLYLMHYS